jgi:RNA-binding protein YlmH
VVHRKITRTQEVLFIRKGKVKVNFYTAGKEYLSSSTLNDGDVIFLCSGGHGFEILKDAQIIEVKQGPYSGKDSDKTVFKGIEKE